MAIARVRTARDILGWVATTTALAVVTALFAIAHVSYWRRTGDPKGVCFAVQELAVVVVALVRRRPFAVSRRPSDWLCATLGGYLVLLLRPGGASPSFMSWSGTMLQVAGGIVAAVCIVELGRSFGVVPANRGIRSSGLYGVVRHPIYAAYAVAVTGYLMSAPTLWNAIVIAAWTGFQAQRIGAEEAVLRDSVEYREYARTVRWRLIPGVI